jgi:hypothetical protein
MANKEGFVNSLRDEFKRQLRGFPRKAKYQLRGFGGEAVHQLGSGWGEEFAWHIFGNPRNRGKLR